jgi:ParB/RepB/Spo0J family partition protein
MMQDVTAKYQEAKEKVFAIPLADIDDDSSLNCRGTINPVTVSELSESIRQSGLLQPVVVVAWGDDSPRGKPWRLIAGFRRCLAHRVLGETTINAVVKQGDFSEIDLRIFNLQENVNREDLSLTEEAGVLRQLIEFAPELDKKEDMLAARLGVSRGWVQVRRMFIKLPELVQKIIEIEKMGQDDIRNLYKVWRWTPEEDKNDKTLEAAKALKDAKRTGKRNPNAALRKYTKVKDTKRIRKKPEMLELQTHVRETFGNGIMTRILAWTCGEISDMEIDETFKLLAERHKLPYESFVQ